MPIPMTEPSPSLCLATQKGRIKFQHRDPKLQCVASPCTEPTHGEKLQMATTTKMSTFTPKQVALLQEICGTFSSCAYAINSTMMHALNNLASQVMTGTMKTEESQQCFLNYCATNPDAEIMHRANATIVNCDSDAACIVASRASSRAA